jgi:hypothetical protein
MYRLLVVWDYNYYIIALPLLLIIGLISELATKNDRNS